MRQRQKFLIPAMILAVALSGCTDDDGKEEPQGESSATVCGAFAERPDVASALQEVTGTDSFTENRSKPGETLQSLRSADGKIEGEEILGSPYCRLQSTDDGKEVLAINFREAVAVNKSDTDDEQIFTFYKTGESAYASEHTAALYFRCRMSAPAKEILIHADLERFRKVEASDIRLSRANILVLNAAALEVASELGCSSPELVSEAPRPVSGLHA
ncbi:hypothetical protein AB0900_32675 [Streptomyces cellulosae]|uniref:hypothetical protein n=1 Tax=unclassified Streptomyces TaxID=2593676 RepID=UPI001BE8FE03|nr:hypothetical protein [Streptomyces sp. McG7]WSB56720.1 hypothetical protein OG880_24315 [Streptomyces cellulosae]WTB71773.1 hypothetical protein OIE90_24505 [Streptomyces cellulosae]